MNNIDNSPVEQLWYTWSDVGLSTIHAGFRIRAASPGLTEIYSDRVKSIERNMRYVLPPGTDRSITPDMAPVGFAFIRSEANNNEYLLIHKKYIGEDGVGRQGNFFAHALALGEHRDFSTEDAIWHWEDTIWKTDDRSLAGRSTSLPLLPIDTVYQTTARFTPTHFSQVQYALQFVIEAYLMRRSRTVPIYIAAPADQTTKIATIIVGLTNCLPAQLTHDMTFSTYEPDITKTTAEIVGTSWISTPNTNQDGTAVLPPDAYFGKLAINCQTDQHSDLQHHPQALYNPLAASFASYAAECLATGNVEQLYSLRDYAEKSHTLDIGSFLQAYRGEIADTTSMDERGIEAVLTSDLCVEWLNRKGSRTLVIERVIANPLWGSGSLKEILRNLRKQAASTVPYADRMGSSSLIEDSEQMASVAAPEIRPRRRSTQGSTQPKKSTVTVAKVLTLLAKNMVPEVKRYLVGPQGSNLNSTHRQTIVLALIGLIDSCLLPQNEVEVWERLFLLIEDSNTAIRLLTADWTLQSQFLRIWDRVFPSDWQYNDRMLPFSRISWPRLGNFLKLRLEMRHPAWVLSSIQELVIDPDPLTSQIAKELEQSSSSEIATFLNSLGQSRQPANGTPLIALDAALTTKLVEKGYAINATMASHIEYLLGTLIQAGQLGTAKNLVMALLSVYYIGSERYQSLVSALIQNFLQSLQTSQKAAGQELAEALIKHNFPRSWLVDLLVMFNDDLANLLGIIQFVYPNQEEQSAFFIQKGSNYLGIPEYRKDMLALYQQLLPLNGRQQRLFVLLDTITDQTTILSLLRLIQPTIPEWYAIIERYGRRYLQNFQQVPELANMVVTNFAKLVQAGYPNELLFSLLPLPPDVTGELYVGQLLSAKELTNEQQERFLKQFGASYLVIYPKMPILNTYISTYIVNFHVDLLEEEASKNFFRFLTHNSNYRKLSLDEMTIDKIEKWQTITSYLHQPTANPQALNNLASALYLLNLPNNRQFTTRLAKAFTSCIQTNSDISAILKQMQEVPKLADETDKCQFLYLLAEEAAERSMSVNGGSIDLDMLGPYLVFALSVYSEESKRHFLQNFLDKLFYHIEVHDKRGRWAIINNFVKQQKLLYAAWQDYLKRLEIWQELEARERASARFQGILSWPLSLFKKKGTNNSSNEASGQSSLDDTQQVVPPANNIPMQLPPGQSSPANTYYPGNASGSPSNAALPPLTYQDRSGSRQRRQ
jgi:hypothetical protein